MRRALPILLALLVLGAAVAVVPPAAAAHTYYDVSIRSFDGTKLTATVFVPDGASQTNRVPYVLMTHGWAGERVAQPTGRVLDLLNAGYGVLTWDSRGFGTSGGQVELNSPDFEVKDVQAIVSFVARAVPTAQLDGPNDPRVGMSGGSYAGAIQLLAAAFDPRIDVIAPEITWNDLAQALAPNGVPELYWTSLLLGAGAEASCVNALNGASTAVVTNALFPLGTTSTGCQTPQLALWYATVHATGTLPADVRAALLERSPATYMSNIRIPTLLIQGYPDTLFDVNQAVANFHGIRANGAPAKLWIYDGGHSRPEMASLVPNTQGGLISPLVVDWMDRHLKGDLSVDTGAPVEYFVDGAWRTANDFPLDTPGADRTKRIAGFPALLQAPVVPGAQGSVTFKLMDGPATVAGMAKISFRATGVGQEGIVFASLGKQNGTALTRLADQTQPLRFTYTAGEAFVASDLVAVATSLAAGESLVLTVASTDLLFDGPRVPGFVNIADVDVTWQIAE